MGFVLGFLKHGTLADPPEIFLKNQVGAPSPTSLELIHDLKSREDRQALSVFSFPVLNGKPLGYLDRMQVHECIKKKNVEVFVPDFQLLSPVDMCHNYLRQAGLEITKEAIKSQDLISGVPQCSWQ